MHPRPSLWSHISVGWDGDAPLPPPESAARLRSLLPVLVRHGLAVGRQLALVQLLGNGAVGRPGRGASLAAAARLAGDAVAGVALGGSGGRAAVPGLPSHPLLAPGSAVVTVARAHLDAVGAHASFLTPWVGGPLRITVLDCRDESADHLTALVLVRVPRGLSGLGPEDLQVLGGLLEGWDDDRIAARCGVSGATRQAAGLARRLERPSVDALLLHAAREGLYIPPALWG
jgi:hypothetical protein